MALTRVRWQGVAAALTMAAASALVVAWMGDAKANVDCGRTLYECQRDVGANHWLADYECSLHGNPEMEAYGKANELFKAIDRFAECTTNFWGCAGGEGQHPKPDNPDIDCRACPPSNPGSKYTNYYPTACKTCWGQAD
jgi:hypothetical protein